jgi:hypothetical protein
MDERDKERDVVDETAAPAPRIERETTVIHTGERGGGGGLVAAIVVLILAVVVLFFVFGGGLERAADETDINVNIETPEIKLPDIDIERPEAPAEPAGGNGQ